MYAYSNQGGYASHGHAIVAMVQLHGDICMM